MKIEDLITYEDPFFWILNKPANVHSSNSGKSPGSISEYLLEQHPEQAAVNTEGGLVQRLDFETSGCLCIARNKVAWGALHEQLTRGVAKKSYLALVNGDAITTTVETKLGSRYRGSQKVSVFPIDKETKRALPARTSFSVLGKPARDVALVEAITESGRRHQVRAHAAHAGFPLLGDSLYGSKRTLSEELTAEILPAFFLHAHTLAFDHPVKDLRIQVSADLPEYAKHLQQHLPTHD